jgi:hypothetical protein
VKLPALSGTWNDELVLPVEATGNYDETGDGEHLHWDDPTQGGLVQFFWDGRALDVMTISP